MVSEEDNQNPNIQANDNSVAVGSINVSGSIDVDLIIGSITYKKALRVNCK
jgi:hypothetical protein